MSTTFTPVQECPSCCRKTEWVKILDTDSGEIFLCQYCNLGRKGEINAEKNYYQYSQDKETLELDSKSYIEERIVRIAAARKVMKRINIFSDNKKGKLLDLGCGAGFLLKVARDDGWKITGVDRNSIFVNYAKDCLNLKNIFNATIDDFFNSTIDEQFDVIVCKNVLGHLDNPREIIMKASKYQKKGGLIFIQTPNLRNWWLNIRINKIKKNWPYFATYAWFFDPDASALLLENCGYKIKQIENFPNYISFSLFAQRFCERFLIQPLKEGSLRNKIWRRSQKAIRILRGIGLDKTYMKINVFKDIINVYAIKKD